MKISFRQYQNLLVKYLRTQWPRVILLAILLFTGIGLQLINPQIIRRFIDAAAVGDVLANLITLAILFIGVALVHQGVSVAATYVGEKVGWTATNALRRDLARHCLILDMSFHNDHTPGEMIERIDGDVTALSNLFSQFVIQVMGNGLLLVGILVFLFFEDPRIGFVLTGFALITLVVLSRLRNIAVPHWTATRQASADTFGFLEERISGTEDIRSNRAKPYVLRRFYQLTRNWLGKEIKGALMINIMFNTTLVLFAVGNAVALGLGIYLFQINAITIGTVYLVFHYTNMLLQPIEQITNQMGSLQRAAASIGRIGELLNISSKIEAGGNLGLPSGSLSVEFQDVSFAYVEDEVILDNFSFSLQPGRVLGLLGRTGSGKTTITRLLFRLYDPQSGEIRLGERDIGKTSPPDLRDHIGMVTQDVQLFHASVRDNLTFFDRSIPDDEIFRSIRDLGLWSWYSSLPDGLDTELASGGGGLSAGEAQLLAFTRIFLLKNPGLVILDEASSRLDPATEQMIENAVDKLLEDRSAIIIAHRLGTVQRADEIMILEDGRILEHGERERLAKDSSSHFYGLLKAGLEEVLV